MTLTYCYDNEAKNQVKLAQARFVRKVQKLVPEFKITFSFNPGGIAVWGETMVKISRDEKPLVEACLSHTFSYVRQWDGRDSGRNVALSTQVSAIDADRFAKLIRDMADKPFRRF